MSSGGAFVGGLTSVQSMCQINHLGKETCLGHAVSLPRPPYLKLAVWHTPSLVPCNVASFCDGVYILGIMMWELWSGAQTPYLNLRNQEVKGKVCNVYIDKNVIKALRSLGIIPFHSYLMVTASESLETVLMKYTLSCTTVGTWLAYLFQALHSLALSSMLLHWSMISG